MDRPDSARALTPNGETFLKFYREAMQQEIGSTPNDVAYVERMTLKMTLAATAHDQVNVSTSMQKAARKCGIATTRAAIFAYLRTPASPGPVDVGTISEYGLTQRLSNNIRCF